MNSPDIIFRTLKKKGLTQQALADSIGVKKYEVSQWKSGKTQTYNDYLKEIANFLKVTTDYLLGNEQKNKPFAEAESYSKEDLEFLDKIKRLFPENREHMENEVEFLLAGQHPKE